MSKKALEALKYISNFTCFDNGCYKDKLEAIKTPLEKLASIDIDEYQEALDYILKNARGIGRMFESDKQRIDRLQNLIDILKED